MLTWFVFLYHDNKWEEVSKWVRLGMEMLNYIILIDENEKRLRRCGDIEGRGEERMENVTTAGGKKSARGCAIECGQVVWRK